MRKTTAARQNKPWLTSRLLTATRLFPSLFFALILLNASPAAAAQATAQQKASARAQFERAEKERTGLNGKAQKERTVGEYMRLVSAYKRVYLTTPHALEVPAALLAVAELYHEMGRQFDPKYHQEAIDAYLFLLKQYPTSRYRDDALFTIAQIQQEDQGQRDAAELTYREFLTRFPRSSKAEQAREALKEIAHEREQERKPGSKKALAEEREKQRKMPQVTGLRHWNAENYTRIVIDVEDSVKYEAARIANPDRIYFDVYKAKLSSTLAGKTLSVENGFLKTIRVAQNQIGVVRVVLEVDKVKDYSVFMLPNPYRLVVDVYGEPLVTAKAEAPKETVKPAPAAAKAEKTEKPAARSEEKTASAEPPAKGAKSKATKKSAQVAEEGASPVVPQPTKRGEITMTRGLGLKIGRVVIDAGHGGHDTGTVGPTGLMEKDLCLDVALRLGKLLKEKMPGLEVVYTREDDTFVPLENRTALANQVKADMFVSIHANSSRDQRARGVETYYLNFSGSEEAMEVASRENALSQSSIHELQDLVKKIAKNEKVEESRELAAEVQDALSKRLKKVVKATHDRGVKKAPFVVLIGANMPSILSEVSFLSNPADEKLLKKPEHRQRVAEGLYSGVQTYLQNLGSMSFSRPETAPIANR